MAKLQVSHADQYIGKRIQMRRKETGFTAEQLSEQIGISSQQLLRYERGDNKINIQHLILIAQALQTPLNWFLLGLCACQQSPQMQQDNQDLKARYDYHWQQFSAEQRQAIIQFLDLLHSGEKKL